MSLKEKEEEGVSLKEKEEDAYLADKLQQISQFRHHPDNLGDLADLLELYTFRELAFDLRHALTTLESTHASARQEEQQEVLAKAVVEKEVLITYMGAAYDIRDRWQTVLAVLDTILEQDDLDHVKIMIRELINTVEGNQEWETRND